MQRYIGLDVHAQSCTLAVMGPSGKRLKQHVVETNAKALVEVVKTIPQHRYLCMEEGELSQWIYETLERHVDELVVTQPLPNKGNKSDAIDAWNLADQLRLGSIKTQVFKSTRAFSALREATKLYRTSTRDLVRSKNQLRSIFRSRGISGMGDEIYDPDLRAKWIKQLATPQRQLAQYRSEHLDRMIESREQAETWLLEEASKSPEVVRIATAPGIGTIRAAQIAAIVISPTRFRTKQQFWSYCGLAIVKRSSSDWFKDDAGWTRKQTMQTRGLNRNRNAVLKEIFTGAAKTVIERMRTHPLHEAYQRLIQAGTKPNLARLTIARRIAAAVLAMWKKKEDYDSVKHQSIVAA
jgi:transposase